MAESNRIKKIKLSNGAVYSIFDEGALRLNADKKLVTGNSVVDQVIIQGSLSIAQVDDVDVSELNEDILVQSSDGTIKKQNIRKVLKELGAISADVKEQVLHLDVIDISKI